MTTERKLICGTREELIEYYSNIEGKYSLSDQKYSIESQLAAIIQNNKQSYENGSILGQVWYVSFENYRFDTHWFAVLIIPPKNTMKTLPKEESLVPDVVEEQRLSMQVAFGKPKI